MSKYETGAHEVPLGTLVRLARFLMVSTDYLLAGACAVSPLSSDPRLLDRFQRIAQMGPAERETWIGLLDGFLAVFRVVQMRVESTAAPSPPGEKGIRAVMRDRRDQATHRPNVQAEHPLPGQILALLLGLSSEQRSIHLHVLFCPACRARLADLAIEEELVPFHVHAPASRLTRREPHVAEALAVEEPS